MEIQNLIAQNTKAIRSKKKLTLDEAAKLTGVSKSMLAQIEKGDVNPTITVVSKIASGYKVSFSALMENRNQKSEIIRMSETDPLVENENGYVNYPVFPFRDDRSFETYLIRIDAKGHLDAVPHIAGTEEYITVFSGICQITVNGESTLLYTGDSIHFHADVPHQYENIGNEQVLLSMMLYYNNNMI